MDNVKHLIISLLLSLGIVLFGTIGYMVIEGWNAFDSLYMTVITISTVGFGEVHPLSQAGRVFTLFLVIIGVGFALYVAGSIVQFMVEGRIRAIFGRRTLKRKIMHLKDHYIVCGYGRIGRVLCERIRNRPIDVVVIEKDERRVPVMDEDGVLYIAGDATDEAVLTAAGILRAKGLVTVLATDADNVFLVLTARQLAPELSIITRASREGVKKQMLAAGADHVASPYEIGAISMAQRIMRPTVTSFLDLAVTSSDTAIQLEEIPVGARSPMIGVMLKDTGIRQRFNLILIAIKNAAGEMLFNPSFESVIRSGDTVIAVGEPENLQKLEKILNA